MDEQTSQKLEEAKHRILTADARLRIYAYSPDADEHTLYNARSDWQQAETILWEAVKERESR
jgi:hypothetical protein